MKNTNANRSDFISLHAAYQFVDKDNMDEKYLNQPILVATWGLRRMLGRHFNFEAGVGGGLGLTSNNVAIAPYLNLCAGYVF